MVGEFIHKGVYRNTFRGGGEIFAKPPLYRSRVVQCLLAPPLYTPLDILLPCLQYNYIFMFKVLIKKIINLKTNSESFCQLNIFFCFFQLNQSNYKPLGQSNYKLFNQSNYKLFNQSSYKLFNQSNYKLFNQSN